METSVMAEATVTYLTNACGEETGHGEVTEADLALVEFESGPGALLTYVALVGDLKVLIGCLEIAHQDEFWRGDDKELMTEEHARSWCESAMQEMRGRLRLGCILLPLDEAWPARFAINLAIPLSSIESRADGRRALEEGFGDRING